MNQSSQNKPSRLDFLIAFLIAVVSATFALATWRISMVSSSAGDASRRGLLDAIKKQAFLDANWGKVYQEAGFAENYAVYLAEIETLEASGDPTAAARLPNLRQYLLSGLQTLADPLATDSNYQNPDGTYNLQERFDVLGAEDSDLRDIDPQVPFQLADRYYAEQRWLTVATVLLAISLFWLALAEIGGKRLRILTMLIGCGVYGVGLLALVVIEAIFFLMRGGVL
jgi:hypothetical protein